MANDVKGLQVPFSFSGAGGTTTVVDASKMKSNMLNALLTKHPELIFNYDQGSYFKDALMDPNDPVYYAYITSLAQTIISAAEPRVTILNIEVIQEEEVVRLKIIFRVIGFETTDSMLLEFALEENQNG